MKVFGQIPGLRTRDGTEELRKRRRTVGRRSYNLYTSSAPVEDWGLQTTREPAARVMDRGGAARARTRRDWHNLPGRSPLACSDRSEERDVGWLDRVEDGGDYSGPGRTGRRP
jgi:hypothetical protein